MRAETTSRAPKIANQRGRNPSSQKKEEPANLSHHFPSYYTNSFTWLMQIVSSIWVTELNISAQINERQVAALP